MVYSSAEQRIGVGNSRDYVHLLDFYIANTWRIDVIIPVQEPVCYRLAPQ
jgi:hypothetical protein